MPFAGIRAVHLADQVPHRAPCLLGFPPFARDLLANWLPPLRPASTATQSSTAGFLAPDSSRRHRNARPQTKPPLRPGSRRAADQTGFAGRTLSARRSTSRDERSVSPDFA